MAVTFVASCDDPPTQVSDRILEFTIPGSAASGDLMVLQWLTQRTYVAAAPWYYFSSGSGAFPTGWYPHWDAGPPLTEDRILYGSDVGDPQLLVDAWSVAGLELAFYDGGGTVRVALGGSSIWSNARPQNVNLTFWRDVKQVWVIGQEATYSTSATPAHTADEECMWTSFWHHATAEPDWDPDGVDDHINKATFVGYDPPGTIHDAGYKSDDNDLTTTAMGWELLVGDAGLMCGWTVGMSAVAAADPPVIPEATTTYPWQPIYPVATYADMPGTTLDDMALMMEHNNVTIEDHLSTVILCDCNPEEASLPE